MLGTRDRSVSKSEVAPVFVELAEKTWNRVCSELSKFTLGRRKSRVVKAHTALQGDGQGQHELCRPGRVKAEPEVANHEAGEGEGVKC